MHTRQSERHNYTLFTYKTTHQADTTGRDTTSTHSGWCLPPHIACRRLIEHLCLVRFWPRHVHKQLHPDLQNCLNIYVQI